MVFQYYKFLRKSSIRLALYVMQCVAHFLCLKFYKALLNNVYYSFAIQCQAVKETTR